MVSNYSQIKGTLMDATTHPRGMQPPTRTSTTGGEDRQDSRRRYIIQSIVWGCGLIVFLSTCVIMHSHPAPYAIDLTMTHTVQGWQVPSWLHNILIFPSIVNNPMPSMFALIAWAGFMLVMALIFHLRHKSSLPWIQAAVFLVITVLSSAGLNTLVDIIVNRPRPNPATYHIHLYTPLVPFPTYPSGHTEHDIAFYGFLLYLSFTRPVREWRYHLWLIPLQIYAVYDILCIGYSRILEGDHWFTDVLGGYLEGAIYLFLFIFLYRWTTTILTRRHPVHLM
jgi:membrane-associated phospholipid phosphatase